MGIYYDSMIAHGLLIPGDEDVELSLDTDDMYEWLEDNTPPGFMYATGGNYMAGEDYHYVITTHASSTEVLMSARYGFAAVPLERGPSPLTVAEVDELRNFANKHGLEPLIGWWGINSCG